MSKITRNALELKELIPSELLSVYEIETSSILYDENEMLKLEKKQMELERDLIKLELDIYKK